MVEVVGDRMLLHQSDLDTWNRCNERSRFSLIHPQLFKPSNDAAVRGTGMHAAIAAVLDGTCERSDAPAYAYAETMRVCETETVRYIKDSLPSVVAERSAKLTEAWCRHIYPTVEPGGMVEADFQIPLGIKRGGLEVWLAGEADYIPPTRGPDLYDWKSSGRKFTQREKQRTAIQPTAYAYAMTHGAFGEARNPPITFRFGVMVIGASGVTTQMIDVQRGPAHEGWLLDMIDSYFNLLEGVGLERSWPKDEDHFLCNEVWCPAWNLCKGARLSTAQDNWSA